jgi:hypothetical protein
MTRTATKKEKISGAVGTLLIHLLLLLLFFFLKFPANVLPAGNADKDEGILIDFGNAEKGSGEEFIPQTNKTTTNTKSEQTEEKFITQNTEPTINISSETKTKTEQKVTEPQPQLDQNLLSAMNKLNTSSQTKSGEGNTTGENNEGDPFGNIGADVYSEGTDGGHRWKLKGNGRKMIGKIEIHDESQETGIVAVEITVDKYGKVIKANPVLMGSTTTNQYLWNKAREGLFGKVLYNSSPRNEEARGVIYINFTLK